MLKPALGNLRDILNENQNHIKRRVLIDFNQSYTDHIDYYKIKA